MQQLDPFFYIIFRLYLFWQVYILKGINFESKTWVKKNRILKNINIQIRPWSGVHFNYIIGDRSGQALRQEGYR